jgi:hypothetical protein
MKYVKEVTSKLKKKRLKLHTKTKTLGQVLMQQGRIFFVQFFFANEAHLRAIQES